MDAKEVEAFLDKVVPTAYNVKQTFAGKPGVWSAEDNISTAWSIIKALEDAGCQNVSVQNPSILGARNSVVTMWFTPPLPATEPTAAAQGEGVPASVDDLSPAQKEVWVRLALNQADVQIAALEAALQQSQRERDAANELLAKIERRMPMVQPFDLGAHYYSETYNAWLVGDWIRAYQKVASAQQAAQPADGEG